MTLRAGRRLDPIIAMVLGIAAVIPYRGVRELWFLYDDFFQIRFASAHRLAAYWTDAQAWRELPIRMLTPLLFTTLDADLTLFGTEAAGYYGHQLLSFGLVVALVYLALRQVAATPWAIVGTLLFAFSAPAAGLVQLLMVRHYIEGLLFALVSIIAFQRTQDSLRGRRILIVASALSFFLAASAKEIFVPLPFFLLAICPGSFRERFRTTLAHFLTAALYVVWRLVMLGTITGGYGWNIEASAYPRLAAVLPWKLVVSSFGDRISTLILLVLVIAVAMSGAWSKRRAMILTITAVILFAPLLPVSASVESRYAVLPWLALIVAFVIAIGRIRVYLASALAGAAMIVAVWNGHENWSESMQTLRRMSAEERFLAEASPGDVLRNPAAPANALVELKSFSRDLLKHDIAADFFYDDLFLCSESPKRLYAWTSERIAEITSELPAIRARHCPLTARPTTVRASFSFDREREVLRWSLAPADGEFAFILLNGRVVYPMPRIGGYRIGPVPLTLRIRHRSSSGELQYTPEFTLNLAAADRFDLLWP